MKFPLRCVLPAVVLLAAASFSRAQSVSAAGETATVSLGSLMPFTATCAVTDIAAGWRPIYPDRAQAGLSDGKQSLVYKTADGSQFTVERKIQESADAVRITDSFSSEAEGLELAKSFAVEFQADAMSEATVEFLGGNRPSEDGKTLSQVAESMGNGFVTASGLKLTTPAGEKLTVNFDQPLSMRFSHVEQPGKNTYLFAIGHPQGSSKSTFEFRLGGE